MSLLARLPVVLGLSSLAAAQGDDPQPPFQPQRLTQHYLAEGVGYGDFDNDGHLDVVCGRSWWAGPTFRDLHHIAEPRRFRRDAYADVFFCFGDDVDGDGWDDVVWIGFPGAGACWFENPANGSGGWACHVILPVGVDGEAPHYVDLDGDGVREIVCAHGGQLGTLGPGPGGPRLPWIFTPISAAGPWTTFLHGLGVGDVNADGRLDVLTVAGWFEQPAQPAPVWTFHPHVLGLAGAQQHVFDADGDGDMDVATSLAAHGYGLSWFEQGATGGFTPRTILPALPRKRWHFSQLHAVGAADMDGDGLSDLVTGKTYYAHLGADPGADDPAVLYVFLQRRSSGVPTRFAPLEVHADSGVGRQVSLVDIDGDGRVDILTGSKKGVFVFRNKLP